MNNYNRYRLCKALNWRPPVERYFGIKVNAKGFGNFWGLEQLDGIYKEIKGDEEFSLEDKKLDKARRAVEAYRKAA